MTVCFGDARTWFLISHAFLVFILVAIFMKMLASKLKKKETKTDHFEFASVAIS